jgi:hypothetical protein
MGNDFEFIEQVLDQVERRRSETGRAPLTEAEQVATDLWAAAGIIGNGSFQCFFECDLDAEACAKAYEAVGLPQGARLFRLALSLFPEGKVHSDISERLDFIREHEGAFDSLGMEVVRLDTLMRSSLAAYLRRAGFPKRDS